jgi:hypothetical protein
VAKRVFWLTLVVALAGAVGAFAAMWEAFA